MYDCDGFQLVVVEGLVDGVFSLDNDVNSLVEVFRLMVSFLPMMICDGLFLLLVHVPVGYNYLLFQWR